MALAMTLMADVDSTLYDANFLFRQVASEHFGFEWYESPDMWLQEHHFDLPEGTFKKLFDLAHSAEKFRDCVPYPDAREVLNRLSVIFDIEYVSSGNPETQEALIDWLRKHDFPNSDRTLRTLDKFGWLQQHKPHVVVDDRVKTLLLCAYDLGIKYCYALKQPWNANLSGGEAKNITICDNWLEIERAIVSPGGL